MKLINDIIVPKVSAYWHVVLVYLEYDVAFKKELEKKHKGDPRQCCTTLFEDWITSSRGVFPKTYRKLLDVLNQIPELVNAAAEIRRLLGKERTIKACMCFVYSVHKYVQYSHYSMCCGFNIFSWQTTKIHNSVCA